MENDCRLGCPVGNLALEVSDTHPELRELLDRNFENWVEIIHRWLEEAGETDARLILTVMEGGVMQARAAGSLVPFDQSVNQLRSYFSVLQDQAEPGSIPLANLA